MVDRIDEKLIGERAAAFAGEVRSSISLARRFCWRSKDREESVGTRLGGLVALVGFGMGQSLHNRTSTHATFRASGPREIRSLRMAACETVSKEISGQMGGSGRSPREFREAKTPHLQVFRSALGRTRTCGLLIRSEPFRASLESRLVPFGPVYALSARRRCC
jgi:hypothetical protein